MNDDELRRLFHDATADIRPEGSLEDIRNRAEKVDPMARRWFLPSLAAAAVMALVIGGAFWMTRDTDDTAGTNIATSPTETPSVVAPEMAEMTLYYVGEGANGPRLFAEQQKVDAADPALSAVAQAAGGGALDPDYTSYWPDDVRIDAVADDPDSDLIRIDLHEPATSRPSGVSKIQAERAVQAIVRTAQAGLGEEQSDVEFYFEGVRQDTVLGVAGPTFDGGIDNDVLALVSIGNLVNEEIVEAGKLTVTGLASAFEANVSWEILVGGDAVIDSGFTTAAECCTLAPYEFTTNIALEGPGTYTLVVHDNDESGEGRPVNQDTKEIVVE